MTVSDKVKNLLNEKFMGGISIGIKGMPSYAEIYKNPTSQDIQYIFKSAKEIHKHDEPFHSYFAFIRFLTDTKNNLYAFDGNVLHSEVSRQFKNITFVNRFTYNKQENMLYMSEGTKAGWSKTFPIEIIKRIKICLPQVKVLTSLYKDKLGNDEEITL